MRKYTKTCLFTENVPAESSLNKPLNRTIKTVLDCICNDYKVQNKMNDITYWLLVIRVLGNW